MLSTDEKMLWLSPGIKISISSKSGLSTFVLSYINLVLYYGKPTILIYSSCYSGLIGLLAGLHVCSIQDIIRNVLWHDL